MKLAGSVVSVSGNIIHLKRDFVKISKILIFYFADTIDEKHKLIQDGNEMVKLKVILVNLVILNNFTYELMARYKETSKSSLLKVGRSSRADQL